MKAGYRYDAKTCFKCGQLVHYNWYIRHRRSGCVSGIVTPRRLTTGSTVTAAPVDCAAPNVDVAQPQVNPDR